MSFVEFLVMLIVAGVCGTLGQAISGFRRGGIFVAIALGFVGAALGTWIARQLALPEIFAIEIGGSRFPVVWSIIGAALFVCVVGLLSRGKKS